MRRLSEEVVFLDTNVVVYAVGTEHPYRLPCQQVMSAIANGTLRAAIDTETVQEILHRYGALRRYAEAVAIAQDPTVSGGSCLPRDAARHPTRVGTV